MRLRFDQLGKQIGRAALGPSGPTIAHAEIAPDAQHADLLHEPDPAREAERARLGLLGRLAAVVCLIEIYGHAPDAEEVLACLSKLLAFRQKRARMARAKKQPEVGVAPFLWVITAGRPSAVLAELACGAAAGWPSGVYFGPSLLRVGIVVASELPRERETLLVRLMAAGPLLTEAIEELSALPKDAHERGVAEQILLNLRHALAGKPRRTAEEQEFIMTIHKTWEDFRQDGRAEQAARAVLAALRVRGVAVPDAARKQILAQTDLARLERWHERAIVAASIAEVLDEPS